MAFFTWRGPLSAQLSALLQPGCLFWLWGKVMGSLSFWVWTSSMWSSGIGWATSQDGKQMGSCSSWASGLTQAS